MWSLTDCEVIVTIESRGQIARSHILPTLDLENRYFVCMYAHNWKEMKLICLSWTLLVRTLVEILYFLCIKDK